MKPYCTSATFLKRSWAHFGSFGIIWFHHFLIFHVTLQLYDMKRKMIPLQYRWIRGSIGKKFVIKHTPWGIIMTKYPDMSRIKPSKAQRKCRNMFREAVAWAKQVIADPVYKQAWQKRLRRSNGVYNAAITYYMQKEKKAMLQANRKAVIKREKTQLKNSMRCKQRNINQGNIPVMNMLTSNRTTTNTSNVHISQAIKSLPSKTASG